MVVAEREGDANVYGHVDEVVEEAADGGEGGAFGEERATGFVEREVGVYGVDGVAVETGFVRCRIFQR